MKKLDRTDKGIEYLKHFAEFCEKKGIAEYEDRACREFGEEMQRSIATSVETEPRIRGIRAEAVFLAVVAGIGKVALIKAEDAGDAYYNGEALSIPDFRIVPADSPPLLVEVKSEPMANGYSSRLKLSDAYVRRLRGYALLTNTELRIATFWEKAGLWTLNRLEAFKPGVARERQWSLSWARAFVTNEMALLGDCTVFTLAPLHFRVVFDPGKSDNIGENGVPYMVSVANVHLLSRETILRGMSAQIALKIILYGNWIDIEQKLERDGDRPLWLDHVIGPPAWDEAPAPDGPMQVGALSEMISRAYLRGAERTIHTSTRPTFCNQGTWGASFRQSSGR